MPITWIYPWLRQLPACSQRLVARALEVTRIEHLRLGCRGLGLSVGGLRFGVSGLVFVV